MLDAQMASEAVDREWAKAAESGIVSAMAMNAIPGVTVNAVECRSSLCRLAVRLEDQAATGESVQSVQSVVLAIPWDGQRYGYTSAADPKTLVVFASREGRRLRVP
jgi:hypothetical protein